MHLTHFVFLHSLICRSPLDEKKKVWTPKSTRDMDTNAQASCAFLIIIVMDVNCFELICDHVANPVT